MSRQDEFQTIMLLSEDERVGPLTRFARSLLDEGEVDDELRALVVEGLLMALRSGLGVGSERLELGDVLGAFGDPRLRRPSEEDYWVTVSSEYGPIVLGRAPVTNREFFSFAKGGGYERRANWSDEGWEWLKQTKDPWKVRAQGPDAKPYVHDNQPVVGITWYEAEAYARSVGARLPRFDDRMWATRGEEKRPYPWGAPFGESKANTREESLKRPCAVGLYIHDVTPEGIMDLAGNVAEWCEDSIGAERWIHPGAWDQPSMAAWAKARSPEAPSSRGIGLGFRLAKEVE